jgi:hypothetical protein
MLMDKEIEEKISNRLIDLIDIIFGVVVAQSFVIIFATNQSYQKLQLISYPLLFLAYAAIVLSWIGYHKMMVYNPYKQNRFGYSRFCLDIFLIFIYALLLTSYENSFYFFTILPIIFLLYAVGGIFRDKEYHKKVSWSKGSLTFAGLFVINLIIYSIWMYLKINNNFLFILICGFTFFYLFYYRFRRDKKGYENEH